ncbi:zinc finger protein, putative [Entamoeba invadens IP1]|uniref:Zinc finger protein, putative n=1 Tax=Entamoeba invadens IP1 TaxID=370355 RepID=A0A0A1TYH2_ENTIV|nr:zinc finger protein, putative [Entamoeba invadens IP1]ELP86566.1 zinc finger protein, putative [Entamoeba invadens IP1]|eukprot:XP_004185912.1 zinc finger protein, putative [Entamoeba invadens IP1]
MVRMSPIFRKHDPNSKKHECLECGKKFRTASEVRRHQSTHSGVKNYQCPIESCGRSFTTNSYLQIHLKSHKTAESFQCTKKGCSMKFFLKTDLIEHVKTCHKDVTSGWGKPAFCCPYDGCPMAFEYPSFLYKHCAAQHQKSEYMCGFDNCYCSFDRFELFLDHLKVVHKMSEEDYKEETVECELCGVPVLKRALQQHMRKAHSTKFVKADEDGNLVVDKDKQWFKV